MNITHQKKLLIGMVYLPPSPHRAGHLGLQESINYTKKECQKLIDAGFDGLLIENEFDQPYEVIASKITINYMIEVCKQMRTFFPEFYLGVEFLINDPKASLYIANESQFNFIRTDYFVDPMSRVEYGGMMTIDPQDLMDYKDEICGSRIKIYTDLQVKYATLLVERSLRESAKLAIGFNSDGLIISGTKSGHPPSINELQAAKIDQTPVIIGSGLDINNIEAIYSYVDIIIVGTSIMNKGVLDLKKCKKLAQKFSELVCKN